MVSTVLPCDLHTSHYVLPAAPTDFLISRPRRVVAGSDHSTQSILCLKVEAFPAPSFYRRCCRRPAPYMRPVNAPVALPGDSVSEHHGLSRCPFAVVVECLLLDQAEALQDRRRL